MKKVAIRELVRVGHCAERALDQVQAVSFPVAGDAEMRSCSGFTRLPATIEHTDERASTTAATFELPDGCLLQDLDEPHRGARVRDELAMLVASVACKLGPLRLHALWV